MKTISTINACLGNLAYASILAGLVLAFVDPGHRARQQAIARPSAVAVVISKAQAA